MTLVGQSIRVIVSDPWEFVTESGAGPFIGEVVGIYHSPYTNLDAVLVRLSSPLPTEPGNLEYLFVFPRHEDKGLDALEVGEQMPCNASPAPKSNRRNDSKPTWDDVAGPSLIGSAELM